MDIFSTLKGIVSPLSKMVDELFTSDDERGINANKAAQIKNEAAKIEAKVGAEFLNYERQLLTAQTSIIVAEASGGSWLKQSWRPITMLTLLALVVLNSFGLLAIELAPEAWTLIQIGLGGYVVGRSAEKIAPKLKNNEHAKKPANNQCSIGAGCGGGS